MARNGRFEVIKKTINCSLQAAWMNTGIFLVLEAYVYYQFVFLALRIINLQLQIATRVPDDFSSHHISYAQNGTKE
jgi:hypothetical protein